MKITIECDNMKELRQVLEGLMVYQPETTEPKKQPREKKEVETVRAKYDDIHGKILELRNKGMRS